MSRDPEHDWFPWDETGTIPRFDPDSTMLLPRISDPSPAGETEAAAERTMIIPPPQSNKPQPGPPKKEETTAAGNSALMAIGSLVSRGTGFLRTAMIAAALGGAALGLGDAYTAAQFFPGMVYEFLIGGVLSSVVVPVLVRARDRDPDGGEAYAQRLLTLAALVLGGAAVIATLCAPILTIVFTTSETGDAYRDLVTALSYFTLPAIFFFGVSAILAAYLNTRGSFGPPMWTPILNNVVVITTCALFIAFFGAVARDAGDVSPGMVILLGGGTLLGIIIQTAGLLPALRRAGFRWRARFDFRALGLRHLGHLGGWMFCYVAVSQVGVLVLLRLLSGNSLLIYNNVFLLMMMAHGIVAVSIVTALMPRMSAASAAGRLGDVVEDLAKGVRTTSAVLAPIAVVFIFLAGPTMTALFVRGAFTDANAQAGASVLVMAGISLIPFSLSQLFTFAFYALPDTKTPAVLNIPVVLLRIVTQVALFGSLAAGGVMLGNGVSYVLAIGLSAWQLRNRIGPLGLGGTAMVLARVAGAMAAAGLVGYGSTLGLRAIGVDNAWVQLILGGALIVVTYLAAAKALRVREIDEVFDLLQRVRRKLLRR